MKKSNSTFLFIALMIVFGMSFCSRAYANDEVKEIQLDKDISVFVDSKQEDSSLLAYGIFSPSQTGFYDMTVDFKGNVCVDTYVHDITKEGKINTGQDFQCGIFDDCGKWEDYFYLEKGKKYAFNFLLRNKDDEADEGFVNEGLVYRLSFGKNSANELTQDKQSIATTKQKRVVYSYTTKSKGMYSFILDTNYDYNVSFVKKNEVGNSENELIYYSWLDCIDKTINIKLDANTEYFVVYTFVDDKLKKDDSIVASICAKNRKIDRISVDMVSNVYTTFDFILDKKFDISVFYENGDVDTVKNASFNNVSIFDATTYSDDFDKFMSRLKAGKYTLKSKYMDVSYQCVFNVVSGYDYAMKNGVKLSNSETIICKEADIVIGYYVYQPSKNGWYKVSNSLVDTIGNQQEIYYMLVDSNGKELEYVNDLGYKLQANKKYAFYVYVENIKPQQNNITFSINYFNHKHTVVVDKAIPATYTHSGKTKGTHCSVCKQVLTKQKVIPKKKLASAKLTKVTNTSKGVSIKWSKVKDATSYVLYRKAGKSGKYVKVAICNKKASSYVDKKIKKSKKKKTYYYVIRAIRTENISKKKININAKLSNVKSVKR